MRSFLFILLSIIPFLNIWASHIVGGDFYYQYRGGDDYRITLKLYVDCENGNPDAIAGDLYGIIGIFDGDNNDFLYKVENIRSGPVHLNGVTYKCIENPGGVCVDQYTYVYDLNLPPRKGGYIVAFQRCCRNYTIKNINNSNRTGATYWVHIPDRSIIKTDNSPIFKKFPPIYICYGFPLVFDHSATDADGDSLSYELYHPYLGGDESSTGARPDPPTNPPFSHIIWGSGYSTQYPMRGNPALAIDEVTGELSVTPIEFGQFVIGVKVKEWRNGVLIGETLRDYQFNIVNCQAVAVAFFKTEIWCSDTVKFFDKSIGATSVSWDFGDPASGITNNTSTAKNPIHVFTRGGDYIVKQKAWNPACDDEYSLKVKVRIKKGFDLGKDKIYCVPFKHQLYVPWNDYTSILWSTGDKTSSISVQKPGQYWVVATYGLCVIRDTINIGYDPISFTPLRDSLFCDKVDATLEIKNRSAKAKILWSIGDTSVKVRIVKEGTYSVRLYNNNCAKNDTFNLVLAKITPNLGPNLFICNDFSQTFDAGIIQQGANYLWNDGSNGRTFTTTVPGKYWVTTSLQHCSKTDTVIITNSKVNLEIGPDRHFCDSVRILVDAGPGNPGTPTFYAWSNGDITQQSFIKSEGKYWVTKSDNFGCTNSDTIQFYMTLSPKITIGKDTTICLRTPIPLSPGKGYNTYEWDDGSRNVIRYTELAGKFYVTVSDEAGCKGSDTIEIKTDPNKLPNTVYIPNAFTPNGDGLNDLFPFETPVLQADYNLKVFTRWGEKIYDTKDTRNPWDGTSAKNPDQLDAYIWVVTYKGCDGNRHTDKGTVIVLR